MSTDEVLLTMRQVSLDGSEVSATLLRLAPNLFTVLDHRGQREPFTAPDSLAAVRQAIRVGGEHETHIDRAPGHDLPLDDLLDALQIVGEPADPEEWAEVGAQELWPLEETPLRWSTAHRVLIDGKPVYGIRAQSGEVILVHAGDPEAPHHSWRELLALHWNNDDNAPVGMAGYGIDGLFLVRPGLLAIVASTDEEYLVTLERVPLDEDLANLVLAHLDQVGHPTALLAALRPVDESEEDSEEMGSYLSTSLDAEILSRVQDALRDLAIDHPATIEVNLGSNYPMKKA